MADTKISGLPASTTPLAGTEVLPIVQSSSTVQVSVANLTAGRAVATGALTVTGAATVSTTLGVTGVSTLTAGAVIQGLTVGRGAGAVATNTAVGASALAANSTGTRSTALGYLAGAASTSDYNVFVGSNAGSNNTGSFNTVVGDAAANFGGASTGSYLVAVGQSALYANTSGNYNTALGTSALQSNTSASNNTAVGYQAGYTNSTGTLNVFLGNVAGYSSTGSSNLHVGYGAGYSSTGSNNTFVGAFGTGSTACGGSMTTGSKNTILGAYSGNQGGLDITAASNYIVLSDGDGNPRAYVDSSAQFNLNVNSGTRYTILLFNNATSTKAQMYWDNTNTSLYVQGASGGVYLTNTGTSWTSNSDERLKENLVPIENGLSKVCSLRSVIGNFIADETKKSTPFLIAQDVQAVLPEAVTTSTLKGDETNTEYLGVAYTEIIPLLVAAIKELKAEVDSLKSQLNGA